MKIELPHYYLRNVTHQSLQNIDVDDVDRTLLAAYPTDEARIITDGQTNTLITNGHNRHPNTPRPGSSTSGFNDFKVPWNINSSRLKTPKNNLSSSFKWPQELPATPIVSLINLSFSQPSTPRTPKVSRFGVCATPYINNFSSYRNGTGIPFTPLLHEAMRFLDETDSVRTSPDFPDILQIIDDENKAVDVVDKHIRINTDVNLCDNTIADYLLDMSNDYTQQKKSQPVSERKPYDEELDKKRKCRRAKPVSYEESLVFHEEKKQRERNLRQKRKERFKQKSSHGTRKSTRRKKRITYC